MVEHLEKALHEAIVAKQLRGVTTEELVRELRRRQNGKPARKKDYQM